MFCNYYTIFKSGFPLKIGARCTYKCASCPLKTALLCGFAGIQYLDCRRGGCRQGEHFYVYLAVLYGLNTFACSAIIKQIWYRNRREKNAARKQNTACPEISVGKHR